MRTAIFENNHQIWYPDAVCFCFNPQEITVQTKNLQPVSNQYFIFSKSEIWSLSLMEHSKG